MWKRWIIAGVLLIAAWYTFLLQLSAVACGPVSAVPTSIGNTLMEVRRRHLSHEASLTQAVAEMNTLLRGEYTLVLRADKVLVATPAQAGFYSGNVIDWVVFLDWGYCENPVMTLDLNHPEALPQIVPSKKVK